MSHATQISTTLHAYQDRLLHLDRRNPALVLRKIVQKVACDLVALDAAGTGGHVEKVLKGGAAFCILRDRDATKAAEAARAHLVALHREAARVEEETGLHDMAVGYPFVSGHAGDFYFRAPFLLWPCKLEHRAGQRNAGWYIVPADGEPPVVNRALMAAIRKRGGIVLSDAFYDELDHIIDMSGLQAGDDVVAFFMARLDQALQEHDVPIEPQDGLAFQVLDPFTTADEKQFEKRPLQLAGHVALGRFPQGSEAIYQDYEALKHWAATRDKGFGVLGELLGIDDPDPQHATKWDGQLPGLDDIGAHDLGLVVPSDASQDEAVLEAQRSPLTVIRGPPGTGKSQVITNLITDALHHGQRVLLVCQKRAALDVVYERLQEVGLADIALLVHDARNDRQATYAKLARLIDLENGTPAHVDESARLSDRIDGAIRDINDIVSPLWAQHHGYHVKDIYSLARPGHVLQSRASDATFEVDRAVVDQILDAGRRYAERAKRFDGDSPWRSRTSFAKANAQDEEAIRAALAGLVDIFEAGGKLLANQDHQRGAVDAFKIYRETTGIAKWFTQDYKISKQAVAELGVENEVAIRRAVAAWPKIDVLRPWIREHALDRILQRARADPHDGARQFRGLIEAMDAFHDMIQFDRDMAALPGDVRRFVSRHAGMFQSEDYEPRGAVHQEFLHRYIRALERRHYSLAGNPFGKYTELQTILASGIRDKRAALAQDLKTNTIAVARHPILPPGTHHVNRRPETEWNRLKQQFQLKRKVKPIRRLYQDPQYDHVWPRIARCWLVSPEACSTIFPLDRGMFDLVIFDEASQLAVERSLPAIYRGKRIVVAGDEQQLRPFDQFRETVEEDEEAGDSFQAESLLVLSKSAYTPRHLTWHYRSKFQELIDFSNHAYYEGLLQIAASTQKAAKPIHWHRVDGRWEDQSNPVEADRVVDLIHEILAADAPPTIGVVTFNAKQRDLIERRIDERVAADGQFAEAWHRAMNPASGRLDDRPFVKNIENVQGDERDAIIFSIAYAPSAVDGKLRLQFGLLSQEGGENRLNVAITRAKLQVHIVASIDPAQLKGASTHLGPVHLQQYLSYAKAVSDAHDDAVATVLGELNPGFDRDAAKATKAFDSPLEEEIHDYLVELGYKVDTQVGYSGYKLDLAVAHPDDPDRYVLAIECDGRAFHSAKSVRERDVAREQFLARHGWKIMRVWSRDWFYDQDAAKLRIRATLKRVGGRVPTVAEPITVAS